MPSLVVVSYRSCQREGSLQHPDDHASRYSATVLLDPENPEDLGAEIYMDIDGERHIITTSGSVYIPAGTVHCPLGFTRVDRPFRFSALSLAPKYLAK